MALHCRTLDIGRPAALLIISWTEVPLVELAAYVQRLSASLRQAH
jgi:hypothetical protein